MSDNQSRNFLQSLFGGKPDDLHLMLWTGQDKRSYWFQDVEEAIRCAESIRELDLYVGVGLSDQDFGVVRRCPSAEIAGIVGIWADIDLKSEAHPKPTLPGSIDQALTILPVDLPPSRVISTGNGVHVWWLFREPYVFDTAADRSAAATLVKRWHTLLRDNASQRGWTFDRLADLARVLRVPGTLNCKDRRNPKPVAIYSQCDQRYNPSEFEEYLDDLGVPEQEAEASAGREWAERFQGKPLIINPSARVPQERLDRWLATDLRLKNTWFRQRHDLNDQSQSGYDLALASFGFGEGCSEQEVVDMIVHHRRLHRQKQRTRLDYFQRTLVKAMSRSADHCRPALKYVGPEPVAPTFDASTPDVATEPRNERPQSMNGDDQLRVKIALCRQISAVLGVEILRIVKLTGMEPLYRMELAEGKIEFPNVAKFISQEGVRLAIAGRVGKLVNRVSRKDWEQLAQMLLNACIEEEGSEELQYEGAARMHIDQYLAETSFIQSLDGQLSQNLRKPLVRDGQITVCASDLVMYINKTTQQNLSVRAVAAMLSAIGAKTFRLREKRNREQSRWSLPLEQFDPADYALPEAEASF